MEFFQLKLTIQKIVKKYFIFQINGETKLCEISQIKIFLKNCSLDLLFMKNIFKILFTVT